MTVVILLKSSYVINMTLLSGYRMDNFYPTSTNFNLSYKNRSTTPAIIMTVVILLKSSYVINMTLLIS